MASSIQIFDSFYLVMAQKKLDLESDTLKVMLLTDAYTPDLANHKVITDITGLSPNPEVESIASPDNGYTQGGEALQNVTLTQSGSPVRTKLDADDTTFLSLTAEFRYAVIWDETADDQDLLFLITFDTTPANITISGIDFIVRWSTDGIIDWGLAA